MNLDATLADNQPTSIGRYKILSELGRGSMAKVYLAQDPVVDRKVALKVISPSGPVDAITWQTLRTRFLLEARAAGKLQHPNAVAIYDADTDEESGLSYIAMEWVDGRSLDKMLGTRGPIPIETTLSIIQQVAGALDAAHSQGLIHRDIKPANILIGEDNHAKLSDFGIVKFEDMKLTSTGGVMGTPLYMSPEQIRGEDLDGRSDLFSLGVVLYQCLTGVAPFTAETVAGLTHQILNADPRAPHWSDPSIPDSLSAAVLDALAKDPSARPQSGAELTQQIEAAMSTPVQTGPVAMPAELTSTLPMSQTALEGVLGTRPEGKKAPTLLIIGFAILTLLAVLALFLDNRSKRASDPTTPVQSNTGSTASEAAPDATLGVSQSAQPQPQQTGPQSPSRTSRSRPGSYPEQPTSSSPEVALPNESGGRPTQSPPQTSTPPKSDDDWIDKTGEIVDDAERIYRISVGKTKRWWDRHAKKNSSKGKANDNKKSKGKSGNR